MASGRGDSEETTPKQTFLKIQRRITEVESYFTDLMTVMRSYASKGSTRKEKYDELTKCFAKYEKVEEFKTTSKLAMQLAAKLMEKVGNEQMTAIQRLEKSVVPNFSSYAKLSKCLKKDVNKAIAAHEKEEAKRKVVNSFSGKLSVPKYRSVVKDALNQLEEAKAESFQVTQQSRDQIKKFENKRLVDLKEGLESFFRIEIAKHAKSLELLTEAYKYIHSIDEHGDLEEIQREFKLKEFAVDSNKTGTQGGSKTHSRVDTGKDELTETSEDGTNISSYASEISSALSLEPQQNQNRNFTFNKRRD